MDEIRPNCEAAWDARIRQHVDASTTIPWRSVWQSLGTPLSDPTEEKAWRKLLHRAWDAKNRHPLEPDHSCRLGCGAEESMLHMIACRHARPLWTACLHFCRTTLQEPEATNTITAVIFGMRSSRTLMSETARALLRHAVGKYYRDVTKIGLNKARPHWTATFRDALIGLAEAAMRYAHKLRLLYVHRKYSNLTEIAPDEARDRFAALIEIRANGTSRLTTEFQQAIDAATRNADHTG